MMSRSSRTCGLAQFLMGSQASQLHMRILVVRIRRFVCRCFSPPWPQHGSAYAPGLCRRCCCDNNRNLNKCSTPGTFAAQHTSPVERHSYRILGSHSLLRCQLTIHLLAASGDTQFEFSLLRASSHNTPTVTQRHGPVHNTRRYTLRAPARIRRRGWDVAADARRVNNALVDKRGREPELHAVSIIPAFSFFHPDIPHTHLHPPEDLPSSRLQPCHARTAPQQRWAPA